MAGTPGARRAEGVPAMYRRRVKNAIGGTLGYFVEVVRPSIAGEEVLWGCPLSLSVTCVMVVQLL